ncbi:hypothetical protein McanMca71_000302 [Microsporum canis]|uniref:DUF887 domain-containing protein n=1 Tax=Arthroderma otae (strain ATCC MYA-4605 / CBS 113480) TaxID=554155 RepID=C5FDL1_ARTOC|nr:DUF887 domain-containing protein [Microsporum canis CBS 113480]EEQ27807.1 DUF887 domain-containing protein [Microsporum canis CBS 113480]
MLDPIPPPPPWLQDLVRPIAERWSLPTLPYHIHEVVLSFTLYQFIQSVVAPRLSTWLFPKLYPNFSRRTKLGWDIHVVSLTQSTLISALALWVIFVDEERRSMTPVERVYGYSGACGLIQAMATGYFLWDLIISVRHVSVFGVGMLFHAISALLVFSLGYRPFVNYYAPTFILYELSTPFLNFHWFFDKLNMTGSRAQWYNGMTLLSVFFSCRLIWGSWNSFTVFSDIYKAFHISDSSVPLSSADFYSLVFSTRNSTMCLDDSCIKANAEVAQFADFSATGTPLWLAFTYLGSNTVLNSLNWYWFSKMIDAVLKRFRGEDLPAAEKIAPPESIEGDANPIILEAAATSEQKESAVTTGNLEDNSKTSTNTIQTTPINGGSGARRRKA